MQDRSAAYKDAGVDIQAAGEFVKRIKGLVSSTFTKGVLTDIGSFGGMFKLNTSQMKDPVLVAATDGVGSKLKLAFEWNKHDTIGIDLVAMSVNDIIVQGAIPLFFLDYLAVGQLNVEQAEEVISGIVEGCKQAKCALLGGETAELPDFYASEEYDLSGFCVGLVDNAKIVDGSSIGVGNKVIGLASSGLHSNGYTLVRKLVSEANLDLNDTFPGTERKVGDVLLEPTRIYAQTIRNLLRDLDIKGMVHITGGGFYENIPRILPRGVRARIDFRSWTVPPVFQWLRDAGSLSWEEMLQIFNTGIGFVLVVSERDHEDILLRLQGLKQEAWVIGEIEQLKKGQEQIAINI